MGVSSAEERETNQDDDSGGKINHVSSVLWAQLAETAMYWDDKLECKANTSRPHPVPDRLSRGLIEGIYCQPQSAEQDDIIWLLKILLIHIQWWTVFFRLVP